MFFHGYFFISNELHPLTSPRQLPSYDPRDYNSPAKPPAMPERIEAVLQPRELGRRITMVSPGEPRGPQGDRNVTGSYHLGGGDWVLEREKLDLDCAECGTQAAQFFWATNSGASGYFVSTSGGTRRRSKNQEIADKQLDQLQLKLASS